MCDRPTSRFRHRQRSGLAAFPAALAAFLAATLIVATGMQAVALAAGAGPGGPAVSLRESLTPAPVAKALQDELDKGDPVRFLVKLATQADVQAAARRGRDLARDRGYRSPDLIRLTVRQEVIRTLRETAKTSQARIAKALEDLKRQGHVQDYHPFWIVNGFAVTGAREAVEALARLPGVGRIDLDEQVHILGHPAEGRTAGGKEANASQASSAGDVEWNVERVGAPGAWALGVDGTGTVVASIDTGVDGSHPALRTRYRGYDPDAPGSPRHEGNWFDAVNGRATPYDDNGHGTHVTGTMVGDDGAGHRIGVAPGARWIAAKAFTAGGTGASSDILEAAQWLLAPTDANGVPHPEWAPDVINNSWGGGPGMDEWFRPMVQAWRAAGIVPVFAAGNDGPGASTVAPPGNYPEALAVGATDANDALASFSSRGPSPYGEIKPEVAAPGVGVRSSVPGGGYAVYNGTSMAAPHVSGTAALLRSANAALSVEEIEALLTRTAVPRTDAQYPDHPNNGYGWGRIDAFAAVGELTRGRGVLTGRVVREGDDLEPPAIEHTPVTRAFQGLPVTITATVADNVGVARVDLFVRRSGEALYTRIPMAQSEGDHLRGTWTATVPGSLLMAPAAEYYLEAADGSGNQKTHGTADEPHTIAVSRGVPPGYFEDFESEPVGWTHGGTNDPWEWGRPTSGPGAAHSGENLFATDLDGDYPNDANAWLLMPPIDLTASEEGAVLRFMHWYDVETNYDFAEVYVSVDGANWTRAARFTGSSNGWVQGEVDLRPYAGRVAYLVFNLFTDGSVTRAGWYIDDVTVVAPDDTPPAAPSNLTAVPNAVAGIDLRWVAPTDADLDRFHVYHSTAPGGPYTLVADLPRTATTYNHFTAPGGVPSYYVVTAVDLWGNESAYSNEASATAPTNRVVFWDDMEGQDPGWSTGGTPEGLWERGTPTSGPGAAHSGANVWATNLEGNYPNNANAWLMTPAIDLTDHDHALLKFAHWYSLERNWDFGRVEVSTDGGQTWTELARYTSPGTGGSPVGWEQPTISLDAYAGRVIRLRFRLTSDGSVQYPGWYIDDVLVIAASAPADALEPPSQEEQPSPNKPRVEPPGPDLNLDERRDQAGQGVAGSIAALPVAATVTIVETGVSVRTDPATGSYTLRHPAGTWTAVAEAYGFYPAEATVTITRDGTTTQNFVLEPIPRGRIVGTVVDQRTQRPVQGARVWVVEDPAVAPATTDADGRFQLDVLEGSYTLTVRHPDYHGADVRVDVSGDATQEVTVELKPFIGIGTELAYDDGTAENAWAYRDSGNGWAVQFSVPEGKAAKLLGARFMFWDASWPSPGGTSFRVEVYAADGPGGGPGTRLAGPIPATARRDGQWTDVDLSELGIDLEGDFFIAYIQDGAYPNVPGLATDENGPFHDRSWQLVGGQWAKAPRDEGNRMIRAVLALEVPPPVITEPADGTYTNRPDGTVTGRATTGTTVTLYNNGTEVGTVAVADGTFRIPVTLQDGENVLTARASTPDGTTDPSEPVRVYLDRAAPELTLETPTDGEKRNRPDLTVRGRAADNLALATVTVNGQPATVAGDGTFSARVLLDEGINEVVVTATDRAGNATTVVRTVSVDTIPPAIRDVEPATDVTLRPSQSLTIRFTSEPNLAKAGFVIVVDGSGSQVTGDPLVGTPMTETAPGVYEGTYTPPRGTRFSGGRIIVYAVDDHGNGAQAEAPGRVSVGPGGGKGGKGKK